jgi:DNA-binding beta-propeller fold protein YncE
LKIFTLSKFLVHVIFIYSLLTVLCPNHVYGIRLTGIQHLFDIENNFKQPSDVSVSKNGLIYVVDGVNNKIQTFDQKGKFLFSFGEKGTSKGKFQFPLGIDIDTRGRVYVADSGNHRVQIFNSTGGFLSSIKIASQNDVNADPTDVAVDEIADRIYVVDNDNHSILVYDLQSHVLIETLGVPGTDKREFRYPFLMTLDTNKYLYIVDVINTRVQVLSPDGKFVSFIGGWGVEKGELFRPKGVTIDGRERVFVSDSYMGVIQTFKTNGEFHSVLGDAAEKKVKKFNTPTGIFVDSNNRLYVVEMFAERVSVFEIGEDIE